MDPETQENVGLTLFSLLFVSHDNRNHVNLSKTEKDPVEIYLRCAITLYRSCKHRGLRFFLITNKSDFIYKKLEEIGDGQVPMYEIEFDRDVPEGIRFYEAHFKLDVVKALGTGRFGNLVGLVDSDVIVLRNLSVPVVDGDWLCGYILDDHTTSVAYADLQQSGLDEGAGSNWFGGELIFGTSQAFSKLAQEIDRLWPVYKSHLAQISHVGDEPIVSAALNNLREKGFISLFDAAQASPRIITRWWSARTLGRQARFREVQDSVILHLPSDKPFLAKLSSEDIETPKFLRLYKAYARRKSLVRYFANLADFIRGKRLKHVPRL